jgi:hypothetical protein
MQQDKNSVIVIVRVVLAQELSSILAASVV